MTGNWIEHRRSADAERLGWMQPEGDGFIAIDLLGRTRTPVVDWLEAEDALDRLGIGYLADPHELRLDDGAWLRVRIVEVSATGIQVKNDDRDAHWVTRLFFDVAFPVSDEQFRAVP